MNGKLFRSMCFIILSIFALSMPMESYAKSRGGGGGFSRSYSSSSRSSSRSSYKSSGSSSKSVFGSRSGGLFGSKKSASKKTSYGSSKKVASTKAKSSKYASSKTRTVSAKTKKSSAKMAAAAKSKKTLKKYTAEQSKYKAPTRVVSGKTYKSNTLVKNTRYTGTTYINTRNTYYTNNRYVMPSYGYNSYSSYGYFDSMFMWMMLDNISDARYRDMHYNRQNTAEFRQWRAEADRLSADNAELKAKLAKLDSEVSKATGAKNPDYVPAGVPNEVMVSATVMAEVSTPTMTMATASRTGNYQMFGSLMKKEMKGKVDVALRNTAGSKENLELLREGKVDAAMIQSDAIDLFLRNNPDYVMLAEQSVIYPEPVQMVANGDSDIVSVKDLLEDSRKYIIVGPDGSGTAMTWDGFVAQDSAYARIPVKHMKAETAILKVKQDPNAVMMYVSGLKSSALKDADRAAAGGKIQLDAEDDWNFNDKTDRYGTEVYHFVDIPGDTYPNLQAGRFYGTNSVETLAVSAVFVVSSNWVEKNGVEAMDKVARAIIEVQPVMMSVVSGVEDKSKWGF